MNKLVNDLNRDAVQVRLETLGFQVRPIPETSNSRQPDLVVQSDSVTLYVEVKTRSEDSTLRSRMEAVRVGKTSNIFTDLDKHNSISSAIKHASTQLSATASLNDFRLLWYRADNGLFVHNTKEQIGSTLYGMRMVLAESQRSGRRSWHCAYASHSDFYRFPDIDGVMVEEDGLITLLLNPFSPRREAFASSRIAKLIHESVFDVDQAIARGLLFAADGDAPRGDDDGMLAHLCSKYPSWTFICFHPHDAVTNMTTIDGSQACRTRRRS